MRRIGLAVVLTVSLTLAPLAAEAQSAKRIPRIGVLAPASSVPLATFEAFRQGLRDLGYVVVMVAVHDPVGSGLVSSLARPGGNVTGLSLLTPDLVAKQLELLKEAVPGISRVAILRNPASSPHAALVKETERAGRMLGLRLEVLETRGPGDFDGAFATMTRSRAGGLLVLLDGMFLLYRTRLAELAAQSRLPTM